MNVALWWETTDTVILTIAALLALALGIALTVTCARPATSGEFIRVIGAIAVLAAIVTFPPSTADAGELQGILNRQMTNHDPFAAQLWADAWSNIQTITACTVLLHYIYIALAAVLAYAVLRAGFWASRWCATSPSAQSAASVAEALRRIFVPNHQRPQGPGAIEPAATHPHSGRSWFKKPAPILLALGAAVAIAATLGLSGPWADEPISTVAPQRAIAERPDPISVPTGNGPLLPSSQPASEPIISIPFALTSEPCSIEVSCAIRNANGRFTLDLAHTSTLHTVSLVPDELIPGRIVTKARWDFDDRYQTSRTVDYDPIKDRGWSVGHDLGAGVRTSQIALTVLSSVPIDPNAGPPPGPGLTAVLTASAGPRSADPTGDGLGGDSPISQSATYPR